MPEGQHCKVCAKRTIDFLAAARSALARFARQRVSLEIFFNGLRARKASPYIYKSYGAPEGGRRMISYAAHDKRASQSEAH